MATKTLPGFSRGVRENSAVRMLTMARPICPNSQLEMEQRDGKWVPKAPAPDRMNCQLAGGKWWVDCANRGHNPYFQHKTWTTTEPLFEEETDEKGNKTGRKLQTGTRTVLHSSEDEINTVQVAISIRVNSGQGATRAMETKGYRRLKDFGYPEVCQYRNCQKEIDKRYHSSKYGDYCSARHLQLVAADQQGVLLHAVNTGLEGPLVEAIADKRDKQLREAAAFAVDA